MEKKTIPTNENSNIFYEIDEKNGVTYAKLYVGTIFNEVRAAAWSKNIPFFTINKGIDVFRKKYSTYNSEYSLIVTKAICSKDDTFDEKIGMRIARERLLEKYYTIRLNMFRCIGDVISEQIDAIEDQMNYSWVRLDRYTKFNQETHDKQKVEN